MRVYVKGSRGQRGAEADIIGMATCPDTGDLGYKVRYDNGIIEEVGPELVTYANKKARARVDNPKAPLIPMDMMIGQPAMGNRGKRTIRVTNGSRTPNKVRSTAPRERRAKPGPGRRGTGLDVTANEIRFRVVSPERFRKETFRYMDIGIPEDGVRAVGAKLKKRFNPKGYPASSMVLQSFRFDRNAFTPSQAERWVQKYADEIEWVREERVTSPGKVKGPKKRKQNPSVHVAPEIRSALDLKMEEDFPDMFEVLTYRDVAQALKGAKIKPSGAWIALSAYSDRYQYGVPPVKNLYQLTHDLASQARGGYDPYGISPHLQGRKQNPYGYLAESLTRPDDVGLKVYYHRRKPGKQEQLSLLAGQKVTYKGGKRGTRGYYLEGQRLSGTFDGAVKVLGFTKTDLKRAISEILDAERRPTDAAEIPQLDLIAQAIHEVEKYSKRATKDRIAVATACIANGMDTGAFDATDLAFVKQTLKGKGPIKTEGPSPLPTAAQKDLAKDVKETKAQIEMAAELTDTVGLEVDILELAQDKAEAGEVRTKEEAIAQAAEEIAMEEVASEMETTPFAAAPAVPPGHFLATVEYGALTDVPMWEPHRRGKNWFAAIEVDPREKGGFARRFAKKAKGDDFYYLVEDWMVPGTPVEFGADYYSGSGNRSSRRWYGLITEVTPFGIVLKQAESGRNAVALSKAVQVPKRKSNSALPSRRSNAGPCRSLLPSLPRSRVCVDTLNLYLSRRVPHFVPVSLCHCGLAEQDHAASSRNYAHTIHKPHTICVAKDIEQLPQKLLYGIMAHEYGHIFAEEALGASHSEEDADRVARLLFDTDIQYTTPRRIQTLGRADIRRLRRGSRK